MFWVRIRLGGREYLGVLDTGATISIVARKILPCGSLKNTRTTAAIRMGDGHVVHSCGDCEVEVPMGSRTIYVMDTEAFDFVLGTDFFVQQSQIESLSLQAPYLLYVDHGSGRESVPLEQSEHTSSYLRISKEEPSNMMAASKTEDYQLLGEVLDQGLKELGYSREDLRVELFASDKHHVLDLYCRKGKNCSYTFYWPSFGMAYGNSRFSELGKVLTKVALERSRMVLCSPDWGAHGGNEYRRNLLDRLTISSVRLPEEAIYVPLGRKTPIGKPGWGSMLSVVNGRLASIPWEDLDSTLVQAIQRESDGLALGDLKDRLRPQDALTRVLLSQGGVAAKKRVGWQRGGGGGVQGPGPAALRLRALHGCANMLAATTNAAVDHQQQQCQNDGLATFTTSIGAAGGPSGRMTDVCRPGKSRCNAVFGGPPAAATGRAPPASTSHCWIP